MWLTVLRSIKSCVPQPLGSGLSTCSWNCVKLLKPLTWRRERKSRLQEPHAVGFERDADLMAQKGRDGRKVLLRPGSGSGGVAACPMLPRYAPSPFNDPRVEKIRSTSSTSKKASW